MIFAGFNVQPHDGLGVRHSQVETPRRKLHAQTIKLLDSQRVGRITLLDSGQQRGRVGNLSINFSRAGKGGFACRHQLTQGLA